MILIIGGSTATGKTELATAVAKKINGALISADSMQIYKKMDIGTAKVKSASLGVEEYLVDIVEPNESFTVVNYRDMALETIETIKSAGKIPIVVGGTGFYISSLLFPMNYGGNGNSLVKKHLLEELEANGKENLHKRLAKLDPVSAQKIHFNNTKRLVRALEVTISTGKPFSEQNLEEKMPTLNCKMFSLLSQNRENLCQRIVNRVDTMFDEGLENEVAGLLNEGISFDMQSMQGIGYKEWRGYFADNISKDMVRELIIKGTKAYAKRQETWFKNQYSFSTQINMEDGTEKLSDIIVASIVK